MEQIGTCHRRCSEPTKGMLLCFPVEHSSRWTATPAGTWTSLCRPTLVKDCPHDKPEHLVQCNCWEQGLPWMEIWRLKKLHSSRNVTNMHKSLAAAPFLQRTLKQPTVHLSHHPFCAHCLQHSCMQTDCMQFNNKSLKSF